MKARLTRPFTFRWQEGWSEGRPTHSEEFPAGHECEVLTAEYDGRGALLDLRPGAPPSEWRHAYIERGGYEVERFMPPVDFGDGDL